MPLLLAALIAVLARTRKLQSRLSPQLVLAATLMIALGYPGGISGDNGVRRIFGLLSSIPFADILIQVAKMKAYIDDPVCA
ncbi:hypothetical protein DZF95_02275 [Clavibacter michiganensis]|nr:hypothetical protein DZF95_02275 [Clavibacter michiganensis]